MEGHAPNAHSKSIQQAHVAATAEKGPDHSAASVREVGDILVVHVGFKVLGSSQLLDLLVGDLTLQACSQQ